MTTFQTTTLSQRGLSIRIGRSVSWIRKHGPTVSTTVVLEVGRWIMRTESWTRKTYEDDRFKYYELVPPASEESVA